MTSLKNQGGVLICTTVPKQNKKRECLKKSPTLKILQRTNLLYGNEDQKKYLDYYLEDIENFSVGIKELANLVLESQAFFSDDEEYLIKNNDVKEFRRLMR
jgi:hypothetical protein